MELHVPAYRPLVLFFTLRDVETSCLLNFSKMICLTAFDSIANLYTHFYFVYYDTTTCTSCERLVGVLLRTSSLVSFTYQSALYFVF